MPVTFGHIGWREARTAEVAEPPLPQEESSPAREDDTLINRFVYVAVGLYAVTFAILSVLQHESFQTNAFDLGNMDQAVWNTAQGRPLEFTNWSGGATRLAAHVEPVLFLVAPLYHLYSSPLVLLILQSVVISLGAIPAFWLGRDVLRNRFAAAVFSFSYLLSPALEIANLADFHAVAFASAFLLYAFYFAHRGRYLLFFIAAILAMATKEHVPMSVFVMGLYIALVQGRPRVGYSACVLAALWAGVAFGFVIPHFNPQGISPYLSRYDQLGKSPLGIVTTVLLDPEGTFRLLSEPAKGHYVLNLLSPTLFLPLLSPVTLAMALPDLAINLLSNFQEMFAGRAHYGSVIVPFVTVSSVLGAGLLRRVLARLHPAVASGGMTLVALLVLGTALAEFYQQVFLPLTDHLPRVTAHHQGARALMSLIPQDAAVAASSTLNPHVSQRRQLSLFPEIDKADYIFLDVTATPYPLDAASQWWRVVQLLQSGQWGVVAARDGYLLLRRGAEAGVLPEEFYTFVRAEPSAIATRLSVAFGSTVELVGYSLEPGRVLHGHDPYAKLRLFWRVQEAPTQDFLVAVSVVGEEEQTILVDRHQPTLLWYPSQRWEPGRLIEVVAPWLPLGDADRGELRVTLVEREPPYRPVVALAPQPLEAAQQELLRNGGLSLRITGIEKG
ncbi:MAG: DUF2079 domain-containing protein [Chloroflexi bacterium]|nr:DUF2079 domain-containing protein [Chloroflexota bacterium]